MSKCRKKLRSLGEDKQVRSVEEGKKAFQGDQTTRKWEVAMDNDPKCEYVEDKPSKMQPIRIKINLAKKQAMLTNMDIEESSTMGKPSKAVGSSTHRETQSDCEKQEYVESLEESAIKPPLNENRGGIWISFDRSLLDTLNAGLCFTLTKDGQVMLNDC